MKHSKIFITIKGTEVSQNLHNSPKTQPHTPKTHKATPIYTNRQTAQSAPLPHVRTLRIFSYRTSLTFPKLMNETHGIYRSCEIKAS